MNRDEAVEATNAAVAIARGAAEVNFDLQFALEHREDPCFAETGGHDGTLRSVAMAVAEVDESTIEAVVNQIRSGLEANYELRTAGSPEGPGPVLFADGDEGLRASVVVAVPKDDHGWQVVVTATSACYEPSV